MNASPTILLVEDNPDDEALTLRALRESRLASELAVSHNGADALDYLFARGRHAGRDPDEMPALVLLDLKLPEGMKINKAAPMSFYLQATDGHFFKPESLKKRTSIAEPDSQVAIAVPLQSTSGPTKIKLSLTYYYCREGSEGLCRVGTVSWIGDVELSNDAKSTELRLAHTIE